jgi:glyceraldehyde 3-phosphate dehydrogenase
VLPELAGKLDGFAIRVPTINVSMVDLTFQAARETSREEIEQVLEEAAQGRLQDILGINREPLVSIDFNHDPRSSVYESSLTRVIDGRLVKVCAWYDNEWGFSNRMLDTTVAFVNAA